VNPFAAPAAVAGEIHLLPSMIVKFAESLLDL
jgi:hypothetical protein